MSAFLGQHSYGCLSPKGGQCGDPVRSSRAVNPKARLFEELNSQPEILRLLEDLRKATGMPMLKLVAPDEHGPFVGCGDGTAANPLCEMIGTDKETCFACASNQHDLIARTASSGLSQTANCFVGLTEFSVPVMEGRHHVATLVSGQVFLKQPSEKDFARVAAKFGKKARGKQWTERARKVFFGTPVISSERIDAIRSLLSDFGGQLAGRANRHALATSPTEHPAVLSAKKFVECSTGEISLDQVLDHVHVSRFHFCKIFRKNTGMTLTEYVNRYRLEKVKQQLADPALRVSDAAFSAGFGSIAQFNALFRREVGMSPSAYRASLKP